MAKENKRYYWLKLPNTYFNKLEQKKMKRQECGKDMQIIYLRMMLMSIDKGGYIYFQGVYDTLEEELAEEFDEDVEVVKKTIAYLKDNSIITINEDSDCFIPEALEHTGSETDSARRMRKSRKKQEELSQCDTHVTRCDTEIEKEIELEKELEKEKEYIHTSKVAPVQLQGIIDMFNEICISYPKVTKLSAARQKAIKARLKVYSIEDFRELFTMAEQSHFLKGGNNRNWSANFDWLIKDANMAKVLDGNYNDSTNRNTYQNEPESQEDPQKDFEEYLKRYGLDKQEPIDWGDVDVPFK